MKTIPLIAGLAGLCLAIALLEKFGISHVLALLSRVGGFGFIAFITFHLLQMLCSAAGWRAIADPARKPPAFWRYFELRVIREGVNNLLPVAQIGGPVISARLLHQDGMALPAAIGSTVADLTMEIASQVIFTLYGVILLLATIGHSPLTANVVSAVMVAATLVGGFVGAQWLGLASVFEAGLVRMGKNLGLAATARIEGLNEALLKCYRRPGHALLSLAWHGASWLLGGLEVCLALHFLGHNIDMRTGIIIESIGQALKSAGFVVPGALGLQEGGYILICGVFNLSPELAIALSLMKRLREIALGIPGLALWHQKEGRTSQRSGQILQGPLR